MNKLIIVAVIAAFFGAATFGVMIAAFSVKPASSAMAVIDASALSKLATTINKLSTQVDLLEQNTEQNRQMLDAIGEASTVAVPFIDGAKMARRLNRSWGCLFLDSDDLQRAMPGLDLREEDLGSICGARNYYRKGLFADQSELSEMDARTQIFYKERINKRRENVASESVLRALGTATTSVQAIKEYNASIEEHKSSAGKATTQSQRLAVIGNGQVLIAQGIAQSNVILSQILKVLASSEAKSLPLVSYDNTNSESKDESEETP